MSIPSNESLSRPIQGRSPKRAHVELGPDSTLACQVSSWSKWTSCSKKCGGGTTNRKRTVINVNKYGGKSCPTLAESKACNEKHCPVNCVVSPWAGWPSCSKTCGGGAQTTTRSVTTPAKYGGRYMLRDQPFVF